MTQMISYTQSYISHNRFIFSFLIDYHRVSLHPKNKNKMKSYFSLFLLLLAVSACKRAATEDVVAVQDKGNSIYFWKTTFKLSDEERVFLSDNQIQRLYLRYFDVGRDAENPNTPIPQATVLFRDSIPLNFEIVPVVFIDNELFKVCDMYPYAKRITDRIHIMSETNDVGNIREIQLDCDWTKTTETAYFDFLRVVRNELFSRGIDLSVTIRLHQLQMKVPPVDRGILMCYNTGAVRNKGTGNSVLSASDVAPYANKLKNYALPLDIAYPTFSWAVWFNGSQFQALLRGLTPDNENLVLKKANLFTVKEGFYQEGHYLATQDEIRFEFSDYQEIMKVKKMLEPQLSNYSVILYHLDAKNLSKYTHDEIRKIYTH
jgi:hypothetical protein